MKKLTTILLTLSLTLSACGQQIDLEDTEQNDQKSTTDHTTVITDDYFAEWSEDDISFSPSLDPYQAFIDLENPENSNVVLYENTYLSQKEVDFINENNFVVNIDKTYDEYYQLYEENRYDYTANFITVDSILHTYHLYFNHLLESLEKSTLYNAALNLSKEMLKESQSQYQQLKGTENENAALRNVAYFAVAVKILNPNSEIPSEVKEKVENELSLIEAHQGITESNILGTEEESYLEDYSQYIPRGHYTKSEELKRYFNALMWYGRMTFRLKNIDETKSALLHIEALANNPDTLKEWEKIYEPINFFVGEPDDISYYQYRDIALKMCDPNDTITKLIQNKPNLDNFIEEALLLPDPKINSMPVLDSDFIENDRDEETKGYRFLGQRSTVDAMIFQKLIYRDVDINPHGEKRMLPKALDIPATFGSNYALEILEKWGDTEYLGYTDNMKKLNNYFINEMPVKEWTKNLYWGWISVLKTMLEKDYTTGYPSFMTNKAYKLKELVTFLGSWTELKHDTILYAKQVYAEMGGAPLPEDIDDRGYVEPNPVLYNKLKSLINLTIDGLEKRELLPETDKENLQKLETIVTRLRDISIKELENTNLTEEDYEFIRSYGGNLEHFFYETLSEEDKDKTERELLNGHPHAIVADVATDPNCCVLEEAVGQVSTIYVVFPIDNKLHVAKGGMFSHYEFTWPMSDRLTDEKWRELLFPWQYDPSLVEPEFTPEIAEWQKQFTTSYQE